MKILISLIFLAAIFVLAILLGTSRTDARSYPDDDLFDEEGNFDWLEYSKRIDERGRSATEKTPNS